MNKKFKGTEYFHNKKYNCILSSNIVNGSAKYSIEEKKPSHSFVVIQKYVKYLFYERADKFRAARYFDNVAFYCILGKIWQFLLKNVLHCSFCLLFKEQRTLHVKAVT